MSLEKNDFLDNGVQTRAKYFGNNGRSGVVYCGFRRNSVTQQAKPHHTWFSLLFVDNILKCEQPISNITLSVKCLQWCIRKLWMGEFGLRVVSVCKEDLSFLIPTSPPTTHAYNKKKKKKISAIMNGTRGIDLSLWAAWGIGTER